LIHDRYERSLDYIIFQIGIKREINDYQKKNFRRIGIVEKQSESKTFNIIPIEVKSSENIRSKSLTFYRKEYTPEISIRFSLKNLQYADGLLNMPLFLADYSKKIISTIVL